MGNFINPLGNNVKKRIDTQDSNYYTEFDSQPAFPILSPYDGIVSFTRETNTGYTIKIKHNINNQEIESKFENLSTIYVSPGQQVTKEQKIGLSGKNRIKLFITNKSTNKSEKPQDWIKGDFVKKFDSQSTETKSGVEPEKETSSLKSKFPKSKQVTSLKDKKAGGLASLLAIPFGAMEMGIKNMFSDAEEANKEREEKKQKKELEKEMKKKEKEKDLSPDIQFEHKEINLVTEEINRIKELMK